MPPRSGISNDSTTKPPGPLIAGLKAMPSSNLSPGTSRAPARATNEMLGRFGENLWWLRTQRRFSQEVLAERAGIHYTQISVLERGGPRKSDFAPDFGHISVLHAVPPRKVPALRQLPPGNPHVPGVSWRSQPARTATRRSGRISDGRPGLRSRGSGSPEHAPTTSGRAALARGASRCAAPGAPARSGRRRG